VIPAELRERRQWVVWRYETRDGRETKVPYVATRGRWPASSIDPSTWRTYLEAVAAARDGWDGIGFVFTADDPYFGVDLDEGLSEADRGAIMRLLDTYSERSVSGRGYHVIGRGCLNGNGRHPHGLGVFDHGRYFVMTGDHVQGTPATIEERQAQLDELLARYLPAPEALDQSRPTPRPVDVDDQELLERARTAKNGSRFDALWRGDAGGYGSQSEADLALCGLLAFWTGGDPGRIDRLFRSSGLYREKWERAAYRQRTIEMAINGRSEFYAPRSSRPELEARLTRLLEEMAL